MLLLDANLSGRRIGRVLRTSGHDVLALSEEIMLEGLDDTDVLALATTEGRILITRNSRDFAPILREWAEAGRQHAGCVLVLGFDHGEFDAIVRGIDALLRQCPSQEGWEDLVLALSRTGRRGSQAPRG